MTVVTVVVNVLLHAEVADLHLLVVVITLLDGTIDVIVIVRGTETMMTVDVLEVQPTEIATQKTPEIAVMKTVNPLQMEMIAKV